MAIYNDTNRITCPEGNNSFFVAEEIIAIEHKYDSAINKHLYKECPIKKVLRCTKCGKLIDNPNK